MPCVPPIDVPSLFSDYPFNRIVEILPNPSIHHLCFDVIGWGRINRFVFVGIHETVPRALLGNWDSVVCDVIKSMVEAAANKHQIPIVHESEMRIDAMVTSLGPIPEQSLVHPFLFLPRCRVGKSSRDFDPCCVNISIKFQYVPRQVIESHDVAIKRELFASIRRRDVLDVLRWFGGAFGSLRDDLLNLFFGWPLLVLGASDFFAHRCGIAARGAATSCY